MGFPGIFLLLLGYIAVFISRVLFVAPMTTGGVKKNIGFGRVISYLNSGNDPYCKITDCV